MSERDQPKSPKRSARGLADQDARKAREAEALRRNLQKRKAQQRGQQAAETAAVNPPATDPEARLETVRPKS